MPRSSSLPLHVVVVALAAVLSLAAGCSDERLIFQTQVSVSYELLDELTERAGPVAALHLFDGEDFGVMGVVCRELDHPIRDDGIYERSRQLQGGGGFVGWTDAQMVSRVDTSWTTESQLGDQPCDVESVLFETELRAIDVGSCDDLAGSEELPDEAQGELLASSARELSSEDGDCREVAKRLGPSSTNAFTEDGPPIEPVVVVLDSDDLAAP